MLVLIIIFSRNVVEPLNLAGNNDYVDDVGNMFPMSAPLMECTKYKWFDFCDQWIRKKQVTPKEEWEFNIVITVWSIGKFMECEKIQIRVD
jgi:hypothetical protein